MDNLFHPESVNEQVEQLLRAQDAQQDVTPGAATIDALRRIYQEDEALLERAWTRIARVGAATPTSGDITNIVDMNHYRGKSIMHETDFSSETEGSVMPSASLPVHSAPRPRQKHVRVWRMVSLIAATLVAAVIVGSMLLVIGASRKHNTTTGSHATKKHSQVTAVSGPAIYEGGLDKLVRADAQTGKVVWSYQIPAKSDPDYLGDFMQVVPAGKIVYAQVGVTGGSVMAFDAATGRILWTSKLQSIGSIALVQGTLYVGMSGGPNDPNHSYVAELDASTGTQASTQYTLVGSVLKLSVVDNILYAGTDSSLIAIDPVQQKQIWQKSVADFGFNAYIGPIVGFAVAQGTEYVTLQDGYASYCLALHASNGAKQWQAGPITSASQGSGGGGGIHAPVAANGMVYFAITGTSGAVFAYKQGTQVWSYPTGELMAQSTPILSGDTLYITEDNVGVGENAPGQTNLVALDAQKGSVRWQTKPVPGIGLLATMLNGVVYLATFTTAFNYTGANTYAFGASTGASLWQVSLNNKPYALASAGAN